MRKKQLRDQNGRFIKEPYFVSFKPSSKTITGNIECIRMDSDFRFFYDMFNKSKRCMAADPFADKMASMPDLYIRVPAPQQDIEIHIDGPDDLSPVHQCKVAENVWCPKWVIEFTWFGHRLVRPLDCPSLYVPLPEEEHELLLEPPKHSELKSFMLTVGFCLFGLILAFLFCAVILLLRNM